MVKSKKHGRSKTRLSHKSKPSGKVRKEPEKEFVTHHIFFGWRGWCVRFSLMIVVPTLLLSLFEFGLFLSGFGHPATFFVETETKQILSTNEWFVWFYHQQRNSRPHPCMVSTVKPKETIRIFVLGESAAMGTPDPSFGFARILEVMLERYFPNNRVEIVNTAMRGINSHIIVPISRECAGLEPDLCVLYMGNNEVAGLYGPETFLGRHPALIPAIHWIKHTRVYQLLRTVLKGGLSASQSKEETQTMEFFRKHRVALDDPGREAVYHNYRNNLMRICENGLKSGAGVLILTIPVNLRDCPPLASLHRTDLTDQDLQQWESFYRDGIEQEDKENPAKAIELYLKAAAIDNHYAETHFRLARCYLATDESKAAREHFSLARDWDALQFRTDSRLNEIVREVVAEYSGKKVYLVDAESSLAASERSRDGIPGSELFYDHVHPQFDGDYELAKAILKPVISILQQKRGFVPSESASITSRNECAKRLAFTAWDEINTAAAMVKMTSLPPFTDQLDHSIRQSRAERAISQLMNQVDKKFVNLVLLAYHDAIEANPHDWQLRYNLANFLYELQRFDEAVEHLEYVVKIFPDVIPFRTLLGSALARAGYLDQAIGHLNQALERDAQYEPAKKALDWALQQEKGKTAPPLSR